MRKQLGQLTGELFSAERIVDAKRRHARTPRSWRVDARPSADRLLSCRRFTHTSRPGVTFGMVDRDTFFDGEARYSVVIGVALATPGAVRERFVEDGLTWL